MQPSIATSWNISSKPWRFHQYWYAQNCQLVTSTTWEIGLKLIDSFAFLFFRSLQHMMFFLALILVQATIGWLVNAQSGSGFPKDMNLYVTFPPILERHESIPLGHLRPLGWQRRAEAPILEDSPSVTPDRFYHLFVQGNRSVVIRGIVPPLDVLWTDSYLSKRYGHLNITVAKRKQRLVDTLVQTPLKTFLEQYRQDDLYMNTIIPDQMKPETPLPSLINCGTFRDRLLEPILWISAGETASLLQAHAQNTMHCVLDGRRDFIVYDVSNQYPADLDLVRQSNGDLFSRIDVDMANTYKYKRLHHLPWYWATLREGDCLFIPANVFHQVRAHGRTIALSIDMAPPDIRDDFVGNDCEKNPPVYVSLDKGQFQWKYEHGTRHLTKRTIGKEDARNYLLLLLGISDRLFKDIFSEFYNQATYELAQKDPASPTANDLWKELNRDESNETFINRSRLKSLPSTTLQLLADILQKSARIHDHDKLELWTLGVSLLFVPVVVSFRSVVVWVSSIFSWESPLRKASYNNWAKRLFVLLSELEDWTPQERSHDHLVFCVVLNKRVMLRLKWNAERMRQQLFTLDWTDLGRNESRASLLVSSICSCTGPVDSYWPVNDWNVRKNHSELTETNKHTRTTQMELCRRPKWRRRRRREEKRRARSFDTVDSVSSTNSNGAVNPIIVLTMKETSAQ